MLIAVLCSCAGPSGAGVLSLGAVPQRNIRSGEPVETVLADGGDTLWVGTADGRLLAVDAATGALRAERRLSPGPIRALLAVDGGVVVAEQSPTGTVRRVDGTDLMDRAVATLDGRLGRGVLPAADDPWGIYALPAAYGLGAGGDGTVWVAASRGWSEDGERRRAAAMLRLRIHDLSEVVAWPGPGAADAALTGAVVGPGGALASIRGANAGGPRDGVLVFDGEARPESLPIRPLAPWFETVFVWDALAWSAVGPAAGTADGRVVWWLAEPRDIALATPDATSGVPLAASVVAVSAWGDGLVATTGPTAVPWGLADGVVAPPDAHDGANAVWRIGADATVLWTWSAEVPVVACLPVGDDLLVALAGPPGRRGVVRLDGDGRPFDFHAFDGPAGPLAHAGGALFAVERPDAEDRGAWRLHRLAGPGSAPAWEPVPLTVGPAGAPGRPVDGDGGVPVGAGPWVVRGRSAAGGRVAVGDAAVDVIPGGRFTLPVPAGTSVIELAEGTRRLDVRPVVESGDVRLVDAVWPVDSRGHRDASLRADVLAVPPDLGIPRLGRTDDPDLPWLSAGIRVANPGAADRTLIVRLSVRDQDGRTAPGLAARQRGVDVDAAEVRLWVPAGGEAVAVVPIAVQRRDLRSGRYVRRVELWAPGGNAPIDVRQDPVDVRSASAAPWIALALGAASSLAGWAWLAVSLPRRMAAWRRADVVVVGLLAAIGLLHGGGVLLLGMGLASVLGPFAPFALGVPDDAVRAVLLAALLTWVPRPGAAALWLVIGALLRAIALGSVHPVEGLYLGAAVAWTEAALWAAGVTREGFAARPFASRWLRLGAALALPGVALSALSLSVTATLFRMDLHPAYVLAMAAGPGGLYVAVAAGLGLHVADRVARVAP